MRQAVPILAGLAVLALCWQGAIAAFGIPPYILPSLDGIAGRIWADHALLGRNLAATLRVAAFGYAIGAGLGIAGAMLLVLAPRIEAAVMPIVVAINSVPTVAYVPVALVLFGIGPASKVALVALAVGFVIFLNALQGLRSVERDAVNLLRSFGAGAWRIAWTLRLPAALPTVVIGLRVSVVRSMIIAIVAEMLGAYEGLGRLIYEGTQQVDFLQVWAAVTVASLASMTIYGLLVWIVQRLVWWR